jgi:MerR family mercuric resistance operon transcriptional regulator
MRIGELARRTGVNIETIRYYEREAMLPAPGREPNNYRVYADAHRRRLRFVSRARGLGFSLEEVRELLSMIDGGDYTCATVKSLGEAHLSDVRDKIADLRRMEAALAELIAGCHGGRTPDCSMLEALFEE